MAMKLALVTLDIVDEILSVVLVTGVLRDGGEMKSPEIMLVVRGDGHRPVMKLIYIPTLVDVFSLSSVIWSGLFTVVTDTVVGWTRSIDIEFPWRSGA